MANDYDFRECPCAAVDTAYPMTQQGADTPGAFDVPTTAGRITAIRIFISGLSTDVVTGSTCAVHLYGGGIVIGEGWFPGPLISESGAAATSGGFSYAGAMIYKTNIPVKGGGKISADAFVHGEDLGTAHMLLELEYDGEPGRIVDCDYREDDIGAAANTLVTLATRGAAVAEGDFKPSYGTICEIIVGAALDPTGDAANGLVFAPAFQLSGPGLMLAGNYKFLGPAGPTQPDTDVAGNQSVIINPERYLTNIKVKVGNSIRVQAQNIESINPGHAIVAFCYS